SISPSAPVWGELVSVQCTLTPRLDGAVVQWMLNSYPLGPNTPGVTNLNEGRLTAKAADKLAGTWTCSVHKSKNVWKASVELSVKVVMSKKKGSMMLSCQLSDSSEVTDYEWVHVSYDINGTESVGPILRGQTVSVKESGGEWMCRYIGKNGVLGNVTTQVNFMGKTWVHNKHFLHMETEFISTR
ncbi:hypothetical protein GOODEAATRI_016769, partial [Goodea atripinnis]